VTTQQGYRLKEKERNTRCSCSKIKRRGRERAQSTRHKREEKSWAQAAGHSAWSVRIKGRGVWVIRYTRNVGGSQGGNLNNKAEYLREREINLKGDCEWQVPRGRGGAENEPT